MYFQKIEIENTGPIEYLKLEFPFFDGKPKPVIIVGENGTGKSILLSHLVNALVVGKGFYYEDSEVDSGRVYKYRSPKYIKSGRGHSSSSILFTSGVEVKEIQLNTKKKSFGEVFNYSPVNSMFRLMPASDSSWFHATFDQNQIVSEEFFRNSCCLYFPVNRFEEPAWLNRDNLREQASYTDLKHIDKYSNRSIVNISPLKKIKIGSWMYFSIAVFLRCA